MNLNPISSAQNIVNSETLRGWMHFAQGRLKLSTRSIRSISYKDEKEETSSSETSSRKRKVRFSNQKPEYFDASYNDLDPSLWWTHHERTATLVEATREIQMLMHHRPFVASLRSVVAYCLTGRNTNIRKTISRDLQPSRGIVRASMARLARADPMVERFVEMSRRSVQNVVRRHKRRGVLSLSTSYQAQRAAALRYAQIMASVDAQEALALFAIKP